MAFNPQKYIKEGRYDVGAIVRDVTAWYLKVEPNRWTRVEVGQLLLHLSELTERVRAEGPAMPGQWKQDLAAWETRLAAYKGTTTQAPSGHSTALWEGVGMPLLLGYYGGEEQQRTADLATPFSLANQLEVNKEWQAERLRLFAQELTEAAKVAGYGGAAIAAAIALGFLGAFFFWGRS